MYPIFPFYSQMLTLSKKIVFGMIALIYYDSILLSKSKPVLTTTLTIKWAWLYIV